MQINTTPRRRVTVADVAGRIGCSTATVTTMIKRQQLPEPERLTGNPRGKRVWPHEVIEPVLATIGARRL